MPRRTIFSALAIAFSLSLPVLTMNTAEAKWFMFGKDDVKENKKIAVASATEPAKKEIVTGSTSIRVAREDIQNNDERMVTDMLGNTLTMPINVLQPLKGTQKGLESLQKPIKELREPLKNLEPPLKKLDTSVEGLRQPLQNLEPPLSKLTETTSGLNKPISQVGSNISELRKPIDQLRTPLNALRQPISDLGQPVKDLNKPIKGLSKPIGELNQPLQDVATALNDVKDEIFFLKNEIQGIENTVERIVFYILLMVSILCITALFVLYGVFRFLNVRRKESTIVETKQ